MTPRQFFDAVCRPNVSALVEIHDDVRLAVNAILSLDAAVGILYVSLKEAGASVPSKDFVFRNEVATQVRKYDLLRDTAFSLKHGTLDGRAPRLVSRHSQMTQAGVGFGEFTFGRDPFGGTTIFIEKNDGTRERASDVTAIVVRELDQLFTRYGH